MYNTLKTKIKIFCIFKHPKKRNLKIDLIIFYTHPNFCHTPPFGFFGRLAVSKSKLPNHVASCTFTEFSHLGHCQGVKSLSRATMQLWRGRLLREKCSLIVRKDKTWGWNWTLEKISFRSFGTKLSMCYVFKGWKIQIRTIFLPLQENLHPLYARALWAVECDRPE